MATSLAACLHSVGFEMLYVHDVVPLLDMDGVVGRSQGAGSDSLYCPCAARLRVLFLAHMSSGSRVIARSGGNVRFLFLGGACSAFCSLDWVVKA